MPPSPTGAGAARGGGGAPRGGGGEPARQRAPQKAFPLQNLRGVTDNCPKPFVARPWLSTSVPCWRVTSAVAANRPVSELKGSCPPEQPRGTPSTARVSPGGPDPKAAQVAGL